MTHSVLFYVQHLLGIGHLRRAEILAQAMADDGLAVTVAYGGRPFPEVPFRGVRVVALPPAAIAGEDFSTLIDERDEPADEAWRGRRRDALMTLHRDVDPDVLLIELFPFGRRQFAFELVPLLEAVRASSRRAQVACSVRDVLVASKRPGREAEIVARICRFFDAVLVHGDPGLIPFEATFRAADQIADLIRYTGYVAAGTVAGSDSLEGKGEVLVSAGGGAVGAPLLQAAVAARPLTSLADHVWRFLTGPNLPASEFEQLARLADPTTIVERFRPDFARRLGIAALSVSQAGYNTTMDILATSTPAVVVPYETGGETEQRLRADILASKRMLAVVPEADLSPGRLAAAIAHGLHLPPRVAAIDLSGATATARCVHELATRRVR